MESIPISLIAELLNEILPEDQRTYIMRNMGYALVVRSIISPEQMNLFVGDSEPISIECAGCHNQTVRERFVQCKGCNALRHELCIYKKGYCTRKCLLAAGLPDK